MDHTVPATVRRATPSDALALARLRYAFRAERSPAVEREDEFVPRCSAWMAARLGSDSVWSAWLLDCDGEASGTVWLQVVDKLPNPGSEPEVHGYITNFYVRPACRGSGAGSRLLAAALARCRALEVDSVFLWPTERSVPLYERHGFRRATTMLVLE